jgi:formamidase
MKDLVKGTYRLPWEEDIVHKDGTSSGFDKPVRSYAPGRYEPLKPKAGLKAD